MQFYVLEKRTGTEVDTEYEEIGDNNRGEAPRCPSCGRYVGLMPWLPPYCALLVAYGSRLGDIAFGGDDFLVSELFVAAWRDAGLVGLEPVEPVEIVGVRPKRLGRAVPSYYLVAPRLGAVRIDDRRSVIVGAPPVCELSGPRGNDAILALRIDESTWSGEDIFRPWGVQGTIVVTERVVQLARDHDLANVTTIPIEEYSWDSGWRSEGASG